MNLNPDMFWLVVLINMSFDNFCWIGSGTLPLSICSSTYIGSGNPSSISDLSANWSSLNKSRALRSPSLDSGRLRSCKDLRWAVTDFATFGVVVVRTSWVVPGAVLNASSLLALLAPWFFVINRALAAELISSESNREKMRRDMSGLNTAFWVRAEVHG